MSDVTKLMRAWIERPMSVAADVAISTAIGIVAYLLLGIIFNGDGVTGGIRAGLAGCAAAAVYLRARTNLIDPAPAFKG